MSEQDDVAGLVRAVRARVPMDAAQMLAKETPERIGAVLAELPQILAAHIKAYLPPDLFVRYQRLKGRDVVFICGSDEHGVAILIRSMEEGVAPQAVVDRYHAQIIRSPRQARKEWSA